MTKIPSVKERVEEFMSQYAWGKFFTIKLEQEVRENLFKTLTADRTALLTELRDSGLLEEKPNIPVLPSGGSKPSEYHKAGKVYGHNTLARAIKAHLDELINPENA